MRKALTEYNEYRIYNIKNKKSRINLLKFRSRISS
jgi:hypothetical protein